MQCIASVHFIQSTNFQSNIPTLTSPMAPTIFIPLFALLRGLSYGCHTHSDTELVEVPEVFD
jgi:hypothetical protein